MSQNNSNDKAAMLARIEQINQVEGFDPTPFAVDFTDLNNGEVRKRLPVMTQIAWFRLKYPEGKIAVSRAKSRMKQIFSLIFGKFSAKHLAKTFDAFCANRLKQKRFRGRDPRIASNQTINSKTYRCRKYQPRRTAREIFLKIP